ncbi:hypothetical protein A7D00_0114 [Trichophyton violaceum]|uniref:CSN8/PSMD8/EIF3K domain-containing protein n=1 Tax=Trichophyton violaceum TaxID=34388 RepID=A0A178FPU5_TRIVO|nr:hypothetical protein A7D00_0114 [Trichophyton violaceum]
MVLKAATQATGDLHAALTAILIVPRPHDVGSYITDDRIICGLQATTTSSILNGHLNFGSLYMLDSDPVTMSSAPSVPERLTEILSASTSPLESLIELEGEINSKYSQDGGASDMEFFSTYYSSYLICLLLDDDFHEARMMFRRLPLTLLEDDTLMKALEKLVRAVGTRDHGTVYEILKTAPWHKLTEPLVQSYTVHYRNKVIDDTSLSYKTVRLPTIVSKLGLEPDSDAMQDTGDDVPSQLIHDLSAKGWTYDSVSRLMHPARPATQPGRQERITLGQITALIGNHGSG